MLAKSAAFVAWVTLALACGGAVTPPIGGQDAGVTVREAGPPPTDAGGTPPAGDAGASSIACGPTACATDDGSSVCCIDRRNDAPTCQSASLACRGSSVACDDTSDCAAGDVCCAELGDEGLVTSCRKSCITGVPRVRVCASKAECASCAPAACGPGAPRLSYCEVPEFCR